MLRLPAEREELVDAAGRVSRQTLEHVLETTARIMTVELGGSFGWRIEIS
jgi:hypothetical protein